VDKDEIAARFQRIKDRATKKAKREDLRQLARDQAKRFIYVEKLT
jgi:hypothetical protein